jgi:hypothetical protein
LLALNHMIIKIFDGILPLLCTKKCQSFVHWSQNVQIFNRVESGPQAVSVGGEFNYQKPTDPSPLKRLCRNPLSVIASDRRERGNL